MVSEICMLTDRHTNRQIYINTDRLATGEWIWSKYTNKTNNPITRNIARYNLQQLKISPVLTTCCFNPIHNKSTDFSMTNGNAKDCV